MQSVCRILFRMVYVAIHTSAIINFAATSYAQNCPYPLGQADTEQHTNGIVIQGVYAYLTDNPNGIVVYEISDPSNPVLITFYDLPFYSNCLEISGQHLFVGRYQGGYPGSYWFDVLDVSNPLQPFSVSTIDLDDVPKKMEYTNGAVYIANDGDGLVAVDVHDPENPVVLDSYGLNMTYDLDIEGFLAYVAANNRLYVFDISIPSDIQLVSSLYWGQGANRVTVSGQYAYVQSGASTRIIDISDPEYPELVGLYNGVGSADDIEAWSGFAFLCDNDEGLLVIDATQPDQPFLTAQLPQLTEMHQLLQHDGILYAAAGYAGLRTIWIRCVATEPIITENFDNGGQLPAGWTTESHAARGVPWTPVQDNGDDWSVISSQTQYGNTDDEWLISPVFDLSGWSVCELNFWHNYSHDLSQGTLRYSTNSGASWNPLTYFDQSTSGYYLADISSWADDLPTVRFLYIFTGEFLSNGAFWNIDDFSISGVSNYDDTAPLLIDPIPEQPMEENWSDLTGNIGCTIIDPSGVDASSVAVRVDANGDGDYEDGAAENWLSITGLVNSDTVGVLTEVTYQVGLPAMSFEFRAMDLSSTNDFYGYSGLSGAEGIGDDWSVDIILDDSAPQFSDPVPAGQPEPFWIDNQTVDVGCTVWDSIGTIDAASLAIRIDLNLDLDYNDTGEGWSNLSEYTDGGVIIVAETIAFPSDGEFHAEFQATDILGNGPAFSMNEEGISDDILVRIDTTPPAAPFLMLGGTTETNVTLLFSPTEDLTFSHYEVYISEDSLVDETDQLWTYTNDPALGERSTYTTTVTGLTFCTQYWFRMRVIDGLEHVGDWSQVVCSSTIGTTLAPVTDLSIEWIQSGIELCWSEPTEDENGNTPVFIQGFDIHTSVDPFFTPSAETRIATVTNCSFNYSIEPIGGTCIFYRVIALGCGGTMPPPAASYVLVPTGTFMMGKEDLAEPVHQVTLTHDLYIIDHEVTNAEYRDALQWAYEHGLIQIVDNNRVVAYNQDLLDIDNDECEIHWNGSEFFLTPVHWGDYQGLDSDNHPVKHVTWYGAACFCDWLSIMEDLPAFYDGDWSTDNEHNPYIAIGYRLPTEAEWEYSAKYNDNRSYPWGEDFPSCQKANFGGPLCVDWTAPIGNCPDGNSELGLMDMAGNCWELLNDRYGSYSSDAQTDPIGPAVGQSRCMRGGGWGNDPVFIQTSWREALIITDSYSSVGFRVCRTANP